MANISSEKDLEMLKKNADGTFTKYNPHTKASNVITSAGKTVESQLADMAKQTEKAFQFANNGKNAIVNAVIAKGVSANSMDTFPVLANKIGQISTGKKWAEGGVDNNPASSKSFSVRDLSFRPTIVFISYSSWNSNLGYLVKTEYIKFDKLGIKLWNGIDTNTPTLTFLDNGFQATVLYWDIRGTVKWIAIE